MPKGMSTYLDLMRLIAAVGVFLGHSYRYYLPQLGWQLGGHAQASVAIFFVLSGFVIRYATSKREGDWRDYARARATRMYSVALIAIIVTFVADAIGHAYGAAAYADKGYYNPHTTPLDVLSYLTFTNELWFRHAVVGGNEPYWSLGFEVWYYVLFGLLLFCRKDLKVVAVLIWAAVVGPKILMYLPLWLMGVLTHDVLYRANLRLPRWAGVVLAGLTPVAYLLWYRLNSGGVDNMFRHADFAAMVRSATYFSGVGVFASLHLIGVQSLIRERDPIPEWVAKPVVWLAGASFTLYLVHQPILLAIIATFPSVKSSLAGGIATMVCALVIVSLLAELGERRKREYRTLIDWATGAKRQLAD